MYIFGTGASLSSIEGHQPDAPLSLALLGRYDRYTLVAVIWASGMGVAPPTNGSAVPHVGTL